MGLKEMRRGLRNIYIFFFLALSILFTTCILFPVCDSDWKLSLGPAVAWHLRKKHLDTRLLPPCSMFDSLQCPAFCDIIIISPSDWTDLRPVVQNFVSLTLSLSPQFVNYISTSKANTLLFILMQRILTLFQQKITVYL